MYKTIIVPSAKKDIQDAAKWYNEQQNGLGKRFTKDVRKKINIIKQNPLAYAIRYKNRRTAVLDVFPFMVHFTIDDKTILISAILHTSLNPKKWIERD